MSYLSSQDVPTWFAQLCALVSFHPIEPHSPPQRVAETIKLISSRIRVVETENTALKVEVGNMQAELHRVNQLYRDFWTKGSSHASTLATTPTCRQTGETPSYLNATAASISRARSKSKSSNTKHEKEIDQSMQRVSGLNYDDGKLVDRDAIKKANFMKHTKSSLRKIRGGEWSISWQTFSNDLEPTELLPIDSPWPDDALWTCDDCDHLEKNNEDESDQSLKARSRLHEESFFQTPASKCPVTFRLQHRLLRAALRLAQETLWTALRAHWPHIQRRRYLEGPEQVKFGREELSGTFGNETYPGDANEMCGQPRGNVVGNVLGVVYLRNAVCHPSYHSTQEVDRLLWHAQGLAVVLQDEKRVFKIRALRDHLQAEAIDVYEEIKALAGMAALPFARPWPLYLQQFLHEVDLEAHWGGRIDYPVEVVHAARAWKLLYISPGEWHPTYLTNMAKAKSFMTSTPSGRRASVAAFPAPELKW